MDPSSQFGSQFGHLFSWRHPATAAAAAAGMSAMGGMGMAGMTGMDLTHAAYRYNQNMMEYYTCKSKSLSPASTLTIKHGLLFLCFYVFFF